MCWIWESPNGRTLRAQFPHPRLRGDVPETRQHAAAAPGAGFVDFRQQGIRGVRNDRGGDARDDPGGERHGQVFGTGHLFRFLPERVVNLRMPTMKVSVSYKQTGRPAFGESPVRPYLLRRDALHRELGHGVWNLLGEDGGEAAVKRADHALLRGHLGHAPDHGIRVGRVGH